MWRSESNGKMILKDELKTVWEEVVVAAFKTQLKHSPLEKRENP
jgi:hypothetical protein